MPTPACCWGFGRPSVGADDLGGPSPVHRKKDGFPRRPVGPPRNDKGSGLSLRGAKRRGNPHPPSSKAPLCKGSWYGVAVTEGLSGVDRHFGDDLCRDSHPFPRTRWRRRYAVRRWPGWLREPPPPPRRGGPVCPPVNGCREGAYSGRHIGRPLQVRWKPPSTPEERAGTEPRPYASTGSLP